MALNYFHINTEIWYNQTMSKDARYLRCVAESIVCSNSLPIQSLSPADHFFYFDTNIGELFWNFELEFDGTILKRKFTDKNCTIQTFIFYMQLF
jgi:hypothetical protein